MNYLKIYQNIITNVQFEKRKKLAKQNINYVYYEKHHIIPRCMGGCEKEENKVFLTSKEHYLCHKLLTKIYPQNLSIIYAFKYMSSVYKNARDFEYAKKLYSELPASEKTQEKRLKVWWETFGSEKAISEYLDSLKGVHYSPNEDPVVHISFKNKKMYELNQEKIRKNIQYFNENGCYVPSHFK